MKKKIFLIVLMVSLFVCAFAITASAASLSNFINVDLTLNDGSEVEAYLKKGSTWSGYQGYDRVTVYADYTDTSKTISWSDIKVFDGRNSTIHTYDGTTLTDTGAYAQTLLGYQTEASSVTHFYYPQGSLIVADNSFASSKKWNLEYLYVPKSVRKIGAGSCNGDTNLTKVEIESGSQLEEIGGSAFRDCSALTSINLQDTMLKTISGNNGNDINGNVFRGCTSLTSIQFPQTLEYIGYNAFYLSGLSGKLVLPNSVTHLDDGAFLVTKLEALVIGDGPVTIGLNFVGSYYDNNYNLVYENTSLKEVYIPSEATFENTAQTWFKSANQVTFYVIGNDCTTLINSLKSNGNAKYMSIGMASDENSSTYNGVIVEGYSPCVAFYNGEHSSLSDGACTRCGKTVYCDNPEHNLKISIVYESYLSAGEKSTICLDCETSPLITTVPALFTCLGYSAPENGDGGISIKYTVNSTAIEEYTTVTGKTVSYGMFVTTKQVVGNSDIFDDKGNTVNGAIALDVTTSGFKFIALKMVGFNTEDSKKAEFAIGAYVVTTKDEQKSYSYLQQGTPVNGEKYAYIKYNDFVSTNS